MYLAEEPAMAPLHLPEATSINLSWRRLTLMLMVGVAVVATGALVMGNGSQARDIASDRDAKRVVVPIIDLRPLSVTAAPVETPSSSPEEVALAVDPEPPAAKPEPLSVATVEAPSVQPVIPAPVEAKPAAAVPAEKLDVAVITPPAVELTPAWQRYAVPVALDSNRPKIAIVIDDLGLSRTRTERTMELPAPMTLAFLPYAGNLEQQTNRARRLGHELLVHVPMQPLDAKQDPGPRALTVDLPKDEVLRRLRQALGKFDGYVGINNHMGSRFTSDTQSMMTVLTELKRRGLMFLDSQTSPKSVAGDLAESLGMPAARRSVFLDHEIEPAAIRRSLRQLEAVARHVGTAVGIGHPHRETLEALDEWLPTLEERGFQLVPISTIAAMRSAKTEEQVAARAE